MDPVQTVSIPVSDTSGIIVFDSEIPVIEIDVSTKVTDDGKSVDLTVPGSTGIQLTYDLFTIPPGNIGQTLTFDNLIPDQNNQVFYQAYGGVTFADRVICTRNIPRVPLIVINGDLIVAPSNLLNPVLDNFVASNVVYSNGYWYAPGSGSSNFIMSSNGMNWSGTDTSCPYFNTAYDIAFDTSGMGIVVGSKAPGGTGGAHIVALLSNKLFMPIDLGPTSTVATLYSVVFGTKWVAVGRDLSDNIIILESTNGFIWQEITTTDTGISAGATEKVGVLYEPIDNSYNVYSGRVCYKRDPNTSQWNNLLTLGENIYFDIIISNGVNKLCIINNQREGKYLVAITDANIGDLQYETFQTNLLAAQWNGTKWVLLNKDLHEYTSADGDLWVIDTTLSYPNAGVVAFTSKVEKVQTRGNYTLDQETFTIDSTVVPSAPQTFETVPPSIEFSFSKQNGIATMIPAKTQWESSRAYDSFEITFKTDIHSHNTLNFTGDERTYSFDIYPANRDVPYSIKSASNATGTYNFIRDGIFFSNSISWTLSYERIVVAMSLCVSLYTELQSVLQGKPTIPSWVDMSMEPYILYALSGDNDGRSYQLGTFNSIRSLFMVATTDPFTGGATGNYTLPALSNILGSIDETNFDAFELNFIYACQQFGRPYVNFSNIESVFTEVIETAMNGPHPYVFATSTSKNTFIGQIIKLFSLEYFISTDYSVDSITNNSLVVNAPTQGYIFTVIDSFSKNLSNAISALNYGRSTREIPKYTETSVFTVLYDGYEICLKVDSVIVAEVFVNSGALNIQLIANSLTNPTLEETGMNFPLDLGLTDITLQENPDQTVRLKNRIKNIKSSKVELTTQSGFFGNIEKSSLLGNFTVPVVHNDIDYFSIIANYTTNPTLLGIIGTKLLSAPTNIYDSHQFDSSRYSVLFNSSEQVKCIPQVISGLNYDLDTNYPTTIFTEFRNDIYVEQTNFTSYQPVYSIEDNKFVVNAYKTLNKLYRKARILSYNGTPKPTPYLLNPIPGKDLLYNEYLTDLSRIFYDNSILEAVGGRFFCKQSDIFGATLFSDVSQASNTIEFLNLFSGTTGLDRGTYGRIFASVQDSIGVTVIADAICRQMNSPIRHSYNYINSLNNSVFFPTDSKVLSKQIWEDFYEFGIAVATDANGSQSLKYDNVNRLGETLTSPYTISYNNGPQTGISLMPGENIPVLNMPFFGGSTLPAGTTISIYDSSYPDVLTRYFDDNYRGNFPKVYGYKTWIPLKNIYSTVAPTVSYASAMNSVLLAGGKRPLLNLADYSFSKNEFIANNILPTLSRIQRIESGNLFTNIVLPQLEGALRRAFNLDIGNLNYFFTAEEITLFVSNCKVGSSTSYYSNLNAQTEVITAYFVDMNDVYVKLVTEYNTIIETQVNTLIAQSTSSIADLTASINSIFSRSFGPLQTYYMLLSKVEAQVNYYKNLINEVRIFSRAYTCHKNVLDSIDRFNRTSDNLLNRPLTAILQVGPTGIVGGIETNVSKNFIVGISPLDDRWSRVTTVTPDEKLSYARFDPIWKYFEGDIVFFEDNIYVCTDTSRRYETYDVPPGGFANEQRPLGQYGITGTFISNVYGTTGYFVGRNHSYGVQSLLAWEEWHSGPTLTADILAAGFPTNSGFTESETTYSLVGVSGGNPYSYEYTTQLYSPDVIYAKGALVLWGNSIFRCRGGLELINDVGMGIPPVYSQLSKAWVLIGTITDINISPPGSNGVWKLLGPQREGSRYIDTTLSPYSDTGVYNIGDVVSYENSLYQRLANGTGRNQSGTLVEITGIPPPTTASARNDLEWIAYPYIDLSVEGKNLPVYVEGEFYSDGEVVVYKNLAWKNILTVPPGTGWVDGTPYSIGDVVIAYDDFRYVSIKNSNVEVPPYPRNTNISSLFWEKVYDTPKNPPGIPEYNFSTDYNSYYHVNAGMEILVFYSGAVYRWKYDMGIDYSLTTDIQPLSEYGFVAGVEPPPPEPFNNWLHYPSSSIIGTTNPITKAVIKKYSPNIKYYENDIVFYENLYFICTGLGFGTSMNTQGKMIETQLFVPAREITFGRVRYNKQTKVKYNETFVTTEGLNEDDITIPKWGDSNEDPWSSKGFARRIRYKFASGVELVYVTLRHDMEVFAALNYTPSASLISLGSVVANDLLNKRQLIIDATSSYQKEQYKNKFELAEFYNYVPLLRYVHSYKKIIEETNAKINAIYDDWIKYHTRQFTIVSVAGSDYHAGLYGEALQNFFMVRGVTPSIKGLPIYTKQMKLNDWPSAGNVQLIKGDTVGNKARILDVYRKLNLGSSFYFAFFEGLSGRPITGTFGPPGSTATDWIALDGTGVNGTIIDKYTFENTDGVISMSSLVYGFRAATFRFLELSSKMQDALMYLYTCFGADKLTTLMGVSNIDDFIPSLYRNGLFQKTSTNYPIRVPMLTQRDLEYMKIDTTTGWFKGATGIRGNPWYSGGSQIPTIVPGYGIDKYGNQTQRNQVQPGRFEYLDYCAESSTFDFNPNIYRFEDVEETYGKLLTMSDQGIKSYELRDERPLTWKGMGYINQNMSDKVFTTDWKFRFFFDSVRAIYEKSNLSWGSAGYTPATPVPISKENLFKYQGKKPFADPLSRDYMSILQYLFHFKKCSQLEPSTVLPTFVMSILKDVEYQKVFNASINTTIQSFKILMIVVIALGSVAISVVTAGAASAFLAPLNGAILGAIVTASVTTGINISIGTAVIAASVITEVLVAAVMAGILAALTSIKPFGIGDIINTMVHDPHLLLFPSVDTDEGLIVRCSLLSQVAELTSTESMKDYDITEEVSPLSSYLAEPNTPMSYQLYRFSKVELNNVIKTVLPEFSADTDDARVIDGGYIDFLEQQGITGSKLTQFYDNNTIPGTNNLQYIEYLSYTQSLAVNIANYEEELFYPVYFPPANPIPRPALLKIKNIQFGPDDGVTGRPPGFNGIIFASIEIVDPGEGFYSLDQNGDRVPYISHVVFPQLSNYTTTGGHTFTAPDIRIIGRYLYDSPDPAETAIKGIATFNHLNREAFGYKGKVQLNFKGGAEMNGQTFLINPPVYANMSGVKPNFSLGGPRVTPKPPVADNLLVGYGFTNRQKITGMAKAPATATGGPGPVVAQQPAKLPPPVVDPPPKAPLLRQKNFREFPPKATTPPKPTPDLDLPKPPPPPPVIEKIPNPTPDPPKGVLATIDDPKKTPRQPRWGIAKKIPPAKPFNPFKYGGVVARFAGAALRIHDVFLKIQHVLKSEPPATVCTQALLTNK